MNSIVRMYQKYVKSQLYLCTFKICFVRSNELAGDVTKKNLVETCNVTIFYGCNSFLRWAICASWTVESTLYVCNWWITERIFNRPCIILFAPGRLPWRSRNIIFSFGRTDFYFTNGDILCFVADVSSYTGGCQLVVSPALVRTLSVKQVFVEALWNSVTLILRDSLLSLLHILFTLHVRSFSLECSCFCFR